MSAFVFCKTVFGKLTSDDFTDGLSRGFDTQNQNEGLNGILWS